MATPTHSPSPPPIEEGEMVEQWLNQHLHNQQGDPIWDKMIHQTHEAQQHNEG
jgi:hypothetical protein